MVPGWEGFTSAELTAENNRLKVLLGGGAHKREWVPEEKDEKKEAKTPFDELYDFLTTYDYKLIVEQAIAEGFPNFAPDPATDTAATASPFLQYPVGEMLVDWKKRRRRW